MWSYDMMSHNFVADVQRCLACNFSEILGLIVSTTSWLLDVLIWHTWYYIILLPTVCFPLLSFSSSSILLKGMIKLLKLCIFNHIVKLIYSINILVPLTTNLVVERDGQDKVLKSPWMQSNKCNVWKLVS